MISGESAAAASGAEQFRHAYQAMRGDASIQHNLTPPPAPQQTPHWLKAFFDWLGHALKPVGRFLEWLASFLPDAEYARILLWTVIGLGAAVLLWALYIRVTQGEWRLKLPRRTSPHQTPEQEEWAPDQAGARSWLEEADALAAQGRFAEAIHHLLFRSVEDISRRRPALVRPALTSRELAASEGIPGRARELFSSIARTVERSFFARQPANEADWLQAREAYADFALATAWRA